jgi:4-hydroxybenzoate polyprenyltransferase
MYEEKEGSVSDRGFSMLGRLKRAIVISRPITWVVAPLAYAIGIHVSNGTIGVFEIIQMFLLSFPCSFYTYGINDTYDISTDRINPRKKNVIWGVVLDKKEIEWVRAAALPIVLVILGSALLSNNTAHIAVTVLTLSVIYFYSAPPLRLKSIPFVDSLVNAIYAFGPFSMGYALNGGYGFLWPNFILFSMSFSGLHALATIMDEKEDKAAGISTFATIFGLRLPALFASFVFLINVPFAFGIMKSGALVLFFYSLISAYIAVKPTPENVKKMSTLSIIIFFLWLVYAMIAATFDIERIDFSSARQR